MDQRSIFTVLSGSSTEFPFLSSDQIFKYIFLPIPISSQATSWTKPFLATNTYMHRAVSYRGQGWVQENPLMVRPVVRERYEAFYPSNDLPLLQSRCLEARSKCYLYFIAYTYAITQIHKYQQLMLKQTTWMHKDLNTNDYASAIQ